MATASTVSSTGPARRTGSLLISQLAMAVPMRLLAAATQLRPRDASGSSRIGIRLTAASASAGATATTGSTPAPADGV